MAKVLTIIRNNWRKLANDLVLVFEHSLLLLLVLMMTNIIFILMCLYREQRFHSLTTSFLTLKLHDYPWTTWCKITVRNHVITFSVWRAMLGDEESRRIFWSLGWESGFLIEAWIVVEKRWLVRDVCMFCCRLRCCRLRCFEQNLLLWCLSGEMFVEQNKNKSNMQKQDERPNRV